MNTIAAGSNSELMFGIVGEGVRILVAIFVVPIIFVIAFFIGAGLQHLTLWMLGGGKYNFETTSATYGYALGSTATSMMIPIYGSYIAFIWGIVANIIGLTKTQEISTGKAVGAVLIPFLICCLFSVVFIGALIALGMGAALMPGLANP